MAIEYPMMLFNPLCVLLISDIIYPVPWPFSNYFKEATVDLSPVNSSVYEHIHPDVPC